MVSTGGDGPAVNDWAGGAGSPVLDVSVPYPARMYDLFLGGKDNFPADREAAGQVAAAFPTIRTAARANRAFMTRAVALLAGELGVRQFLDVGCGIPASPNLHETAQALAPDCRVVYADHDPIVMARARALLAGTPRGRTAYLDADLRDADWILGAPVLRETLDLSRPVALCLIGVLHFVADEDDPCGIVGRLLQALPSGSYLVLSHASADFDPSAATAAQRCRDLGITAHTRTRAEVERMVDGLDLVDPGLVVAHRWRPDGGAAAEVSDAEVSLYAAVGHTR